jgi:PqqD family protein of HPr-rel-A system
MFWSINSDCQLHWRHWEEEYILFNAASSQTHYLNSLGADILHMLQKKPLTSEELNQKISEKYDFELNEDARGYIDGVLASMDELGLIEPSYP